MVLCFKPVAATKTCSNDNKHDAFDEMTFRCGHNEFNQAFSK